MGYRELRAPLGIAREQMDLSRDCDCIYIVALDHDALVCTVALHGEHLRQLAVAKERQGQGIGRRLVTRLEEEARKRGINRIEMHARQSAQGFYAALGYAPVGDMFVQVGIPHLVMVKTLLR